MHQQEMAARLIDDVEMSMSDVRACNKQQKQQTSSISTNATKKSLKLMGKNVVRKKKKSDLHM